ncbi:VirD4-like conjugal transfer protein, CD1115 family [Dorea longicatena]|uniref:VirD4-like conjugal transfer protein, CD1115 family n=2 Tax=Clostridia TaxID=186801 RepID=UPI0022E54B6E|nr:type IV secretory system conjugative DNA transfer family protein [Dorea longicatena]
MKPEIKKLLILNLPYLLFVWLFDKAGAAVRLSPGADASAKLLHLGDGFTAAFSSIAPSFHPADLALGIAGAVIVRLIIYTKGKNAKKYRRGTEYGSARWGGADDIKPYTDPVFENNIPLTQTERLTMNSRPKQPKYARNKNILVIGGSGSGKTRFFVKPSLMQCTSKDFPTSYIVTDPKGTLILETGKMLQRYKYRIKVLNTINFKKSMKYNPFAYLRSEKDILKLVNTIIANTKGDGEKSGEDFWVKAEKLYYTALIGYIWYEAPEDEKNFTTLLEMINASEAREDDEDFQNPVDLMFERLEEKDPEHFAVKQYKKYKLAAGKTAKSILISCGARLAPFDIKELRELMETDEMELDTIGDRKTALFVIISDTDDTFNFVVSILYTQLFNLLCDKADDEYGGRLPVHVRCLLDEFANIGQIPKFEKLIATIRSREISASIILQSQSQLKAIYKDNADTIVGNCDTTLFLGGKEKTTLKEISEILGKETIDSFNTSETRGRELSHGLNYQKLGKQLMTEDEIAVMDGGKCILQLRGVRPFFSDKFDITKHPKYKAKEVTFSDMTLDEARQLHTFDEYFKREAAETVFEKAGKKITPKLLLEAIRTLPEEKRKAILLYYFEGMNDTEIAELFNTSRSTIQYRRTSSFEKLRKYLEENADEWDEW